MRWKRGALRRARLRAAVRFVVEGAVFFFGLRLGFGLDEEVLEAGCESAVCPVAGNDGDTTAVRSSAKRKNLRNPDTSFFYYRRKLLPRRETSSSARLRISS